SDGLLIGVHDFEAAVYDFNGPWCRGVILFAALLIVIFAIAYLRIVFAVCLWLAPYSSRQEKHAPPHKPRHPHRNKCQLGPTAPVGNGKSLPEFCIAALDTLFPRPILLDAKLVSVPGYLPSVIFLAQMKVGRPHCDPNHRSNDAESLATDKAH